MLRKNIKSLEGEIESIDGWHKGRNFRSSDEAFVMKVEQREVVIRLLFINENCPYYTDKEVRK